MYEYVGVSVNGVLSVGVMGVPISGLPVLGFCVLYTSLDDPTALTQRVNNPVISDKL